MILRDYQQKASDQVIKEFGESDSTLGVMYTGGGKTIVFADVIKRMHPMKSMVIAHTEELIWQAHDKIEAHTGLNCEIEMADLRADATLFSRADVIISTIQTQTAGGNGGRMSRFKPDEFGLLVIDEAHHATADTYRRTIEYYRQNKDLKVFGTTATPDRADEKPLGHRFKSVAFEYEIIDGIHDGWLVPIDQQMVAIKGLDFSGVHSVCGDLNGAELAKVMEAEHNLQGIAGSTIDIVGDRRTLIFTASVIQAEKLCEILNRHKKDMAKWVSGKTDKEERRAMLNAYSKGDTQVMVNCNCLSEGFDNPGVEVVIQAKPTESRCRYAQMIGRATRPLPGVVDGPNTADLRKAAILASSKPSCLIVDFCGNSGKHKLVTSADILGGRVSDEAIARATKKAKAAGKPVRIAEVLDQSELDLRKEEAEERKRIDERRRAHVVAEVKYTKQKVDPFNVLELVHYKQRGWDNEKSLSDKQRSLLQKQGIDPDARSWAENSQLIGAIISRFTKKLCTFKQATTLKKYGYDTNVSITEATSIIDAIAANGWKPLNGGQPAKPANGTVKSPDKPIQKPSAQSSLGFDDGPPLDYYDKEMV